MEMTDKELAQWLEGYADFRYASDDTKETLLQAAARLRQQSEDSARLDWLQEQTLNIPHVMADYFGWGVSLWDDEVHERTEPAVEPTIREAIDKARK